MSNEGLHVASSLESVEWTGRFDSQREGFFSPSGWRRMIAETFAARGLAWRLFLRDFRGGYRQSAGGLLWAVASPAIAIAGFMLLQASGVIEVGDLSMPYPLFAMLGLTIWQAFAGVLIATTGSLASAGEMIRKISFPREALVFGAAGGAIVDLVVRVALLVLLCAWFGAVPSWQVVFLPACLVPPVLFAVGFGFLCAAANALARDVATVASTGLSYLIFAAPVLYPRPKEGILSTIMALNPLTPSLEAGRGLAFDGSIPDPLALTISAVLSLIVFLVGWRLFDLVEPLVAERV